MLDTLNRDYDHSPLKACRRSGGYQACLSALIPVVTVAALMMIGLFNGVVITETVFNYPGMGSFLAQSALSLDVVSVLGITLFSSFILVFGNLVADVLYGIVDPRIRCNRVVRIANPHYVEQIV
jgi:ABC-type dipeptide/oligopeptide/nickel transport system permease component